MLGDITIPRGWVGVEVGGDDNLRFVSTHLETFSPLAQQAQAAELLVGPAAAPGALVLVCDCNSSATGSGLDVTPTYPMLLEADLADAWSAKNVSSALDERIDLVLVRGDFDIRHAALAVAEPAHRTASPSVSGPPTTPGSWRRSCHAERQKPRTLPVPEGRRRPSGSRAYPPVAGGSPTALRILPS